MGKLEGRVAVVTGASRGIGEEIAKLFAAEGARVVCAARTLNEGDHRLLSGSLSGTVRKIKDAGGQAVAVAVDVSSEEDCRKLIASAQDTFGTVDILVNDAALTYYKPIVDYNVEALGQGICRQCARALHAVANGASRYDRSTSRCDREHLIGLGDRPGPRPVQGGPPCQWRHDVRRHQGGAGALHARARAGGRNAQHSGVRRVAVADRGHARHRLSQAHEGHGRPQRRAAVLHGARGAAAGKRAGRQGQRPRHLQPADSSANTACSTSRPAAA